MPKRVPTRHPATKKAPRPAKGTQRKRAQRGGGSEPKARPLRSAAAAQGTRELGPAVPSALPTSPFSLGDGGASSEAMLMQLALAKVLSEWPGPESEEQRREREARQRKRLADLQADAARQVTETLESILSQLSPDSRNRFAGLSRQLCSDDSQRLRLASALHVADGLPRNAGIEVLVALLADNDAERAASLRRLADRYNKGRQKDDMRWQQAKQAWLDAHRRKRPRRAVIEAMKVSGFKKSAVYERARLENWRAEVSR